MEYQHFELFPTSVIRFNTTNLLTNSDIEIFKKDIDDIIKEKTYLQIDDVTPKWQSLPILFTSINTSKNPLWLKLKKSFEDCCLEYLKIVPHFSNNQYDLKITGSRAWFYKRDTDTAKEANPWHNHYPSYLSGVFYLDSSEQKFGGTEFCDPRMTPSTSMRDIELSPMLHTWVIFPGWLNHRTGRSPTNTLTRYVIAADCYVNVSCI